MGQRRLRLTGELDLALADIWVYMPTGPLLHLTLTVVACLIGDWIFHRSGQKALFNPVLLSVLMLVAILGATGTGYQTYFTGAQFVHFLLGPATVALAVPLYRHLRLIRRLWLPILVSIVSEPWSRRPVPSSSRAGWTRRSRA